MLRSQYTVQYVVLSFSCCDKNYFVSFLPKKTRPVDTAREIKHNSEHMQLIISSM